MLTQDQYHSLLGLVTLGIDKRKEVTKIEESICGFLKTHGIEEGDADTWSGEVTYNEGDDPVAATRHILDVLNLEVEPE